MADAKKNPQRPEPSAAKDGRSNENGRASNPAACGVAPTHAYASGVRSGETASQIARRFGVDLDALLDYNGLSRDSVIKAGQLLRIPPSQRASKNQSE